MSAGEGVHAPGRAHDPVVSKALAITAASCFANFRPNSMKVHAGSVLHEPGLSDTDFAEMVRHGVSHAKYGYGASRHPRDGEPEVRAAQRHGLCVMSHSGGTSIPGSSPIDHETLLHLRPDVAGHVNGGTTSLDDEGVRQHLLDGGHIDEELHGLGHHPNPGARAAPTKPQLSAIRATCASVWRPLTRRARVRPAGPGHRVA